MTAARHRLEPLLGYGLILAWTIVVVLLTDRPTYPAVGGPDAFSRIVGTTWIGWVLLFAVRDVRHARS